MCQVDFAPTCSGNATAMTQGDGFCRAGLYFIRTANYLKTMLLAAEETLLISVDIQERLLPAIHDGVRVLRHVDILLQAAGIMQIPVLLTEQYPKGLGATVPRIRAAARGGTVLEKMHFSAWRDDVIRQHISAIGRPVVVIAGIEAHVCVLQTALDMHDNGYRVAVVVDAISSRYPDSAMVARERLRTSGITSVTTEMCVFEWLGTASHPAFKSMSGLIK